MIKGFPPKKKSEHGCHVIIIIATAEKRDGKRCAPLAPSESNILKCMTYGEAGEAERSCCEGIGCHVS